VREVCTGSQGTGGQWGGGTGGSTYARAFGQDGCALDHYTSLKSANVKTRKSNSRSASHEHRISFDVCLLLMIQKPVARKSCHIVQDIFCTEKMSVVTCRKKESLFRNKPRK
jgi:hypothetical protein